MEQAKPHELIKLFRESAGKTQDDVCKNSGITRQALQRYESGKGGMNLKSLEVICREVGIDPAFVKGGSHYPILTNDEKFMKLFIPGYSLFPGFPGLEPLYTLISFNTRIHIRSLYVKLTGIKKYIEYSPFQEPIYAIAIKDEFDNIFLLRRKKPTDYILWTYDLKSPLARILEMTRGDDKTINWGGIEIDENLHTKIREWSDIKRDDIETFFNLSNEDPFTTEDLIAPISHDEMKQLQEQRKHKMKPLSSLELFGIRETRDKELFYEWMSLIESRKS
jgi:transcriptional regulator with XRE-family HTH domain